MLKFLMQDDLNYMEYYDTELNDYQLNRDMIVSRLKEIKLMENFKWVQNSKIHYLNIPVSFDIESSNFYDGIQKKSIMYIYSVNINGVTFIGRTWKGFVELLHLISEVFELNRFNRRMLMYVHNLSFEFQFMRKWLKWYQIFSDSIREVIYAVEECGVEFRCSLKLSGYSLALVSKNLRKYKTPKMVGDLDYSLIRHNTTPLTVQEMKYVTQDTKVVVCYIQECIEEENNNIARLPYTKTGYVRRYCREQCLPTNKTKEKFRYQDLMKSLKLNMEQYQMCKAALAGGFTHGNAFHINEELENVGSFDFCSAYPYVMVSDYFPMTSPVERIIESGEQFEFYLKTYCCLFQIRFNNIRPRVFNENPISFSRCSYSENERLNNGRVVTADAIETTITELDFDVYRKFYVWDSVQIGKFYTFYRGYLPRELILSILELYKNKTTLKGVDGMENEYLKSKANLNSTYGMCVTDIIRDTILYDHDEWESRTEPLKEVSQLTQYNNNYGRFLYYPWGVWVTAHNRHNLFEAIYQFGNDYVYSDTDSIKAINYEDHMEFIKNYNYHVREKLQKVSDWYQIPFEYFEPTTVKGVKKLLGVWEFEGKYDKFKTLGAKRYVSKEGDKYTFTVAGIKKDAILNYIRDTYGEEHIIENFRRNLEIPKEYTGKLTHTYVDTEFKGHVIDYLGVTGNYHEKSSVHLEPAPFKLSVLDAFWDYVNGIQQKEM